MKPSIRSITLVLFLIGSIRPGAAEITVFAAASLTESLTEIGAAHEKATGDKVRFNFAASNTLARQIEAGGPADIFFSADEAQMDALDKKQLIEKVTRKSLLGNTLVVVTATDGPSVSKPEDLAGPAIRRLSLGDPKAVPAGVYAKRHLEKIGLWDKVQAKVAPAENVRAALAVVESGNADAAIVYKTDAAVSKKVKVALEIPASEGPTIVYPAALVSGSKNAPAAKKFLDQLSGKDAGAVFVKRGFTLVTPKD